MESPTSNLNGDVNWSDYWNNYFYWKRYWEEHSTRDDEWRYNQNWTITCHNGTNEFKQGG